MARHRRVPAEVEHKFSDTTIREPEAVRIGLLGGFRVSVGTRTIEEDAWRLRKAASLMKLLALARGHRLHRERVMDLLWPQLGVKAASNNLRGALHVVRRTLASDTASRYLELQRDQLVLCPRGQFWVDVDMFEETAATARRSRDPAAYRAAIDLYAGELLPGDRYEDWTERRREELRQLHLALLTEMAGLYEAREEYEAGIEALRRVLSEESAREEAHVSLMRLYALSGRRRESILQYGRLRKSLARELDTEPDAESRRLYEEIRAGVSTVAPWPSSGRPLEEPADSAHHNLPAPLTSFVGRERETVEAKRLLPMTRLLTLAGAGGSGKTRLALEVARSLVRIYPDGVWMVELAPLSEGGLVAQEVAGALEVTERPGESLADTLVDALGDKEMLLVLDNCEHLIDASARLAEMLLHNCPRLTVLATSREPLGIRGEVVWQVKPLSLPDMDGRSSVDNLMRYEAIRLFVDRARLRLPDFELTRGNAGAVARVCRKLDGIPLAIELATARMGALAVEQVAQRLEVSLDVLRGGARTAAARQQTLRATLDWSHDLLGQAEQVLFRRLSVFAGGWTLDAAEAVCSAGSIEREDVLDLVGGLVDKSLVVAGTATEGAMRYRMLEPVRQYAREKLKESTEAEAVKGRHASFFLSLAEEAEPKLAGPQQGLWVEWLEREHDNFREALSWVLERDEGDLGLRFGGALWRFWFTQSYLSEGVGWLESVLARSSPQPTPPQVKVLEGMGWLLQSQGDPKRAEVRYKEMLELSRELDDIGSVATALNSLGTLAVQQGDNERAKVFLEENLSVLEELEVGSVATKLKRFHAFNLLGILAINEERDYERGATLWEKSLALAREVGDPYRIGTTLSNLGHAALMQRAFEQARALCEEALEFAHELGSTGMEHVPSASINLGLASLGLGEYERAAASFENALLMSQKVGRKSQVIESLEGMAGLAIALGVDTRAARLWGTAEAAREATGIALPPGEGALHEPYLADARSRLGKKVWEDALAEGRAMALDQAIEYALLKEKPGEEADPTPAPPRKPGVRADELTPREREVAVLVARGLTNRQVSISLGISERTAANHVAKILGKLGLRSRAQIASWATEHQLLAPDQN